MCGIIGYIGSEGASSILLEGLKTLEYRGYDSVGIATLSDGIELKKGVGKIDEVRSRLDFESLTGTIGIGHTRWATHGAVSLVNAHPHTDCNGRIAIVHNGIIENHVELKAELESRGHHLKGETDSEVIAHLIEEELPEGFESACTNAFKQLRGSYAILAICEGEKKIVAARKDSPLVLGLMDHCTFFASDVSSFLEWTKDVVYLENHDFVVATEDNVRYYNLLDGEVMRPVDTVEWDVEQTKKGNFEHFMLKEIAEQAETIQRAIVQDRSVIDGIVDEVRRGYGVFFVGCGSSYNAALAGTYLLSSVAKVHVNPVMASEFENFESFLKEETLVFAISQSGETADVLGAVRAAKGRGSKLIGITNVMGSSLTREVDELLMMNSGPEICVLSTKTYTSQVVLMALLAYALAGRYDQCVECIKSLYMDIYNLSSKSMREHLKALAERLAFKEHIYTIGRGLQYATALEAALKIKEVSYIHTEAFAGGELKHGPLALIESGTPVLVFVSEDNEDKVLSNAQEVKARGATVIGVSSRESEVFDYWIKVPACGNFAPVIQAIPMQILAYELAVLKGFDPDKPRNLAKSVTVL